MSQLVVKLNLDTREWAIEETGVFSNYLDICIGFQSKDSPVQFKDLSFGLILHKDSSIVYHTSFPKVNSSYKSTTSEFVETFRIEKLDKNSQYNVTVWANNDNLQSQTTYVWATPNTPSLNDYEVV